MNDLSSKQTTVKQVNITSKRLYKVNRTQSTGQSLYAIGEITNIGAMSENNSTDRESIKEQFIEDVGYWNNAYDVWLDLDPDSFDIFRAFASRPWNTDHLDPKEKALIHLGLRAAVTQGYPEGIRFYIQLALDEGATVAEVKEVFELVAPLGIHATMEGMEVVEEETDFPEKTEAERDEMEQIKQQFEEDRGYWSEIWGPTLRADYKFLDMYTRLSAYPHNEGVLDPKLHELIWIAIDASTTHLYMPGMRNHVRNAIDYGATAEELVELIELVSQQGYDTMIQALPILKEEAEKRGMLSE